MKLAEFFVSLGFDIQGAPELKKLENSINELAGDAAKLLAVFAGATAAMAVMANKALESAQAFRRFNLVTGQSTQELRKWELGIRKIGGETGELMGAIKSLQRARLDLALGRGDLRSWQLLGMAPSDNPFETLKQLRERIKNFRPEQASMLLEDLGLSENMVALLRMTNTEFSKLSDQYQVTKEQQRTLSDISDSWTEFKFTLSLVRDQLVAELLPVFKPILDALQGVVKHLADFAKWLNSGSAAANRVKAALRAMVVIIVAVTGVLTLLVGTLGLLSAAISAVTLVSAPLLIILGKFVLLLGVLIAVVAGVVLLFEDLYVAIQGGDSAIGDMVKKFSGLRTAIEAVFGPLIKLMQLFNVWDKYQERTKTKDSFLKTITGSTFGELFKSAFHPSPNGSWMHADPSRRLEAQALTPPNNQTNNSSSVRQENNIDITVQGGNDPYQVGRAVIDPMKEVLSNAAYQIAAPAQ